MQTKFEKVFQTKILNPNDSCKTSYFWDLWKFHHHVENSVNVHILWLT